MKRTGRDRCYSLLTHPEVKKEREAKKTDIEFHHCSVDGPAVVQIGPELLVSH